MAPQHPRRGHPRRGGEVFRATFGGRLVVAAPLADNVEHIEASEDAGMHLLQRLSGQAAADHAGDLHVRDARCRVGQPVRAKIGALAEDRRLHDVVQVAGAHVTRGQCARRCRLVDPVLVDAHDLRPLALWQTRICLGLELLNITGFVDCLKTRDVDGISFDSNTALFGDDRVDLLQGLVKLLGLGLLEYLGAGQHRPRLTRAAWSAEVASRSASSVRCWVERATETAPFSISSASCSCSASSHTWRSSVPSGRFSLRAIGPGKNAVGGLSSNSRSPAFTARICTTASINAVLPTVVATGKSSTGWFFGFKVQGVFNDRGELLDFTLTPGNVHDIKALLRLAKRLFGKLFGDKGYLSASVFKTLFESFNIQLITKLKRNMRNVPLGKNKLMPLADKLLLRKRAIAETIIDQLKTLGVSPIEHSRHRSLANFLVNLVCGLIAYSLQPNKPSLHLAELPALPSA